MAEAQTLSDICQPTVPTDADVLVLGDAPDALQASWPKADTHLPDQDLTQRYELAVLVHPEFGEQQRGFSQTLAAARDQWAKQVLALVPLATNNESVEREYFSLGFARRALPKSLEQQYCAYGFSILNYKSTPDWLNSKYWANPERWKKN